ncbi:hypothetical protein DN069_13295, partial [Streptacidiphilus pinicola]
MLRFALLGPVAVGEDGAEPVPQPAGIPTTVLTVLLLHANQVVARERLAAAVWGAEPPTAAAAGLRNHVSRLRRQLGPHAGARVRTVAPGYRIEVHDGELDVQRFLDDSTAGRQALAEGDLVTAHRLLSGALALWRGDPPADPATTPELTARFHGWQENRLLAVEGRIEAELGLGRHHDAVAELRALTAEHPLREGLHGLLMLALYRSGRQAEALDVYRGVRTTLADELGVDPSPALRRLHSGILRADHRLDAPTPDAGGPTALRGRGAVPPATRQRPYIAAPRADGATNGAEPPHPRRPLHPGESRTDRRLDTPTPGSSLNTEPAQTRRPLHPDTARANRELGPTTPGEDELAAQPAHERRRLHPDTRRAERQPDAPGTSEETEPPHPRRALDAAGTGEDELAAQ